MSLHVARDRPTRLVAAMGVAVLGLAVALAMFIQFVAGSQADRFQPPDDVPRAVAIPALYAAIGCIAIVGASHGRPHIVLTSGMLCLIGAFLSVATIPFLVPGLVLSVLAMRLPSSGTNHRSEALVAAGVAVLLVAASVALLGTTEARCWEAHESPSNPTYTGMACTDQPVSVGGGDTIASGYDGGVLTLRGAVVEAGLLLAAITLAIRTGHRSTSGDTRPD